MRYHAFNGPYVASSLFVRPFSIKPTREWHSNELKGKALSLFEEGKGYKAVSTSLSVPMHTVRDWYRSYKANTIANSKKRSPGLRPEVKEKILALAKEGRSYSEIVAMTGFNFVRRQSTIPLRG